VERNVFYKKKVKIEKDKNDTAVVKKGF